MGLNVGARVGPYEVVAMLGAGGMGEVYRARDTKLDRHVALKILPELFADDPDRLARFEREAKTLASLNHPHIAQVHGLEEADGVRALVMELVEGEDLAQRLARGPLILDDALPMARQIAEAIEYAHEHGVIHRDIKPANIKLTSDGAVKVLDFGLAKALDAGGLSSADAMNSPTITSPLAMTRAGVILGTAAYMAPEQARGKPVDKRADIWAFGCVLFEMLTAARPFEGETVNDTLAAALRGEPDWAKLPADLPTAIRKLLRRCLEKDPKQRLHDIADARLEIQEALSTTAHDDGATSSVSGAHGRTAKPSAREKLSWAVAALALTAAAGLAVQGVRPSAGSSAVARVLIGVAPADQLRSSGDDQALSEGWPSRTAIALSPDGRSIVFSAIRDGRQQLYLRALDQLDAIPIASTEGGAGPFFSPDGSWIGFWASGALKKIALDGGGPATTICATPSMFGANWASDDTIVFSQEVGGLWRVPASGGGKASQLTSPDRKQGEISHRLPQVLPGNQAVLFTVTRTSLPNWNDTQIIIYSLTDGTRKILLDGGADARYVPTGHIVYIRAGQLMSVPFDVKALAVTGGSVGLVADVMQAANMGNTTRDSGAGQFSISPTGALLYVRGGIRPDPERLLTWIDRAGTEQLLGAPVRAYLGPRLSPDGQRIAVWTEGADRNVWTYDIARGSLTRLVTEGRNARPIARRLRMGPLGY